MKPCNFAKVKYVQKSDTLEIAEVIVINKEANSLVIRVIVDESIHIDRWPCTWLEKVAVSEVKPVLRPHSSITKQEIDERERLRIEESIAAAIDYMDNIGIDSRRWISNGMAINALSLNEKNPYKHVNS